MSWLDIALLAAIQGLAEMLPVSSSAHVIAAKKMMGLDPSSPEMTFLLVMLHTGTMCAVVLYFLPRWRERFLDSEHRRQTARALVAATAATGVVGLALKFLIEGVFLRNAEKREMETLFANLPMIAAALASVGVLIIVADRFGRERPADKTISLPDALWIGAVQGVCVPFRGFSRSGATISTALLRGVPRPLAEDFSFALVVILTPAAIAKEAWRLVKATGHIDASLFVPGLFGMVFSFAVGLLALRWLSNWLENGRWRWFGYYCLVASCGMLVLSRFLS